jgi:antirestriction protein
MISESHLSDDVWDWLALDDDDQELLSVYREHIDQNGTLEQAQESFRGKYTSSEDFAEDFYEECGYLENMPDNLRGYIDWKRVARDLRLGGDVMYVERGYQDVWVFWRS